MAIKLHAPKLKTVYSVEYQVPKNGVMKVCRTDHCDDVKDLTAHVERRGGSILQVGEPRQVEYMDVSF